MSRLPAPSDAQVIRFIVNGQAREFSGNPAKRLADVLRDDLGLTGTKFGCGSSYCGSCTVVVDGAAVRSCVTAVAEVDGKSVTTIEGLASGEHLHPVQEAFVKHLAFQCGYCTPGLIMGAYALLQKHPTASRARIARELEGHLCRCGAHARVLDAVEEAAKAPKGGPR
jgi:aerobic-type carbon monoxide dehydrogenase small subunit (CoxS/CutS family)